LRFHLKWVWLIRAFPEHEKADQKLKSALSGSVYDLLELKKVRTMLKAFAARLVAGLFATTMIGTLPAAAVPVSHFLLRLPEPGRIATGQLTLAPLSAVKFCLKRPDQCRAAPAEVLSFDLELASTLEEVNASVNRRIRPVEKAYTGAGDWRIDPRSGDCNDYAVSKRHALLAAGLPASALLLATALTPWGEGHLVLVVRTDRGDYVLDNLSRRTRPWNATGYTWLKIQSAESPLYWHDVVPGPGRLPLTLAAN
jgi:predicted transglutaminase-like cysteine proteinase